MKGIATITACALLAVSLNGCRPREPAPAPKPAPDSDQGLIVYIPADLDDALKQLDAVFGDKGRAKVLEASEDDMSRYQMSMGLWIRNNWGLWRGSRLSIYFNQLGIFHPDDMSQIILDSYWRKLHGRYIDLDAQVRHHQDDWKKNPGANDG